MTAMRPIATDTHDFPSLRRDGCIYVDKTAHEASYQRILCTLLVSQGVMYRAEDVQSGGRADVVAKHPLEICIFELKVDEPIDKAFAQIRKKVYAEPYRADGRPIWLIGLSFDSTTRRLSDCEAVQFAAEA